MEHSDLQMQTTTDGPEESGTRRIAAKKLERHLGQEVVDAFNDPAVIEVLLNPDGFVWVERLGGAMQPLCRMDAANAQAVIETVAGYHGKEVTRESPLLEDVFPLLGARFAGQLPPVVEKPAFSVRKKASAVFTLAEYVEKGNMTQPQMACIQEAVSAHRNILIVGGTSSGKTTLVNGVIDEMVQRHPDERIVVIEDTGEVQCKARNSVKLLATPTVSMTALLKTTLRMRPDRILVGEVRGPEALDLLMAWNTGHEGGVATIHANSPSDALDRMTMLVSMHPSAPRLIEPLIGRVVHTIVYVSRGEDNRRKVRTILQVEGYEHGKFQFKQL